MSHAITLYGLGATRSARCKWTLRELGLEFEDIDDRSLIGTDALRAYHPQAKFPAVVIDGEPLFESAAICTHLCDLAPDKGLIGGCGTRARALHEQWTSFTLTEIEGYLWSNAKHTSFYPEEKLVPAVVACNDEEIRNGLTVLNDVLATQDFLVGGRFGVTDIIVGWTVNWSRRTGYLDAYDHLRAYLDRLFERDLCTLNPE